MISNNFWFYFTLKQIISNSNESDIIASLDIFLDEGGSLSQKNSKDKSIYDYLVKKSLITVIDHIRAREFVQLEKNIFVHKNFLSKAENAFFKLKSKPKGLELINKIGKSAHKVDVFFNEGSKKSRCLFSNNKGSKTPAVGSSSVITLGEMPKLISKNLEIIDCPLFIALGHELSHSYQGAYGLRKDGKINKKLWSSLNEYLTINGGPDLVSENDLRKEHLLPLRCTHLDGTEENLELLRNYKQSN